MNDTESELLTAETNDPSPTRMPLFHFWRCFWLTFLVVSLGYAWHSFYVPSNEIAWAEDYALAQRKQPSATNRSFCISLRSGVFPAAL